MKKTKKGFTLVELVIVVAVMAVLVAVAIPTVSAITDSAKTSVEKTNAQTIESMIKLLKAEIANPNPDDAAAVTEFTAATIETALEDAALGITSGTYVYNDTTGICRPVLETADAAKKDEFEIKFPGTDDTVDVTKKAE